jgi:hypothetical protein
MSLQNLANICRSGATILTCRGDGGLSSVTRALPLQ